MKRTAENKQISEEPAAQPEQDIPDALLALPGRLAILVVDDNKFNRSLTRTILRKKGGPEWNISLAEDGAEALQKISGEHFDLVFMDIQMPGINGLDTTRAIRARERETVAQRLPVIAMTAYAMEGDRQMCLDAGMDDYIAKPVDPDELVEVIIRNLRMITPDER